MFTQYETAKIDFFSSDPPFGPEVTNTLTRAAFDRAEAEITTWKGHEPTPLVDLSECARLLGIQDIHYKHEGPRFGLGSFKALGGAYAVLRSIQRDLSAATGRTPSSEEIRSGEYAAQISEMTIISATDGNHGRSVAWGAKRLGAKCRIYIHADVSAFRAEALQQLGAQVVRVNGDYDATVAQTRVDAAKFGWKIVSDTSWSGYSQAPLDVMAGYGVMAREIMRALPKPPTHVFLQGGVGGLAASVVAAFHQEWGAEAPRSIVVEPELAPCLLASARAKAPTTVQIEEETLMAGLSCGEPSPIAWDVLENAVHGFMAIPEHLVAPTVRMIAKGESGDRGIDAGESAVAGLIGLICGATNTSLREKLQLDSHSRVVIIGSEGVTDPNVFQSIMEEHL